MSAVRNIEVRYRIAGGDTAWSSPVAIGSGDALDIPNLTRGKTYNVQARAYGMGDMPSLWADQPDLVVPYENQRVAPKNLNTLNVGGIRSAWSGLSISYTGQGATATISCSAATLQDAGLNPSYAASSVDVSGAQGTTVTFLLYYDDPEGRGGAFPLQATPDYTQLAGGAGRIWVGQVDVLFTETDSSGTAPPSGGDGTGGGGGWCVAADAYILTLGRGWIRAEDLRVGERLRCLDPATQNYFWGQVSVAEEHADEQRVLVTTARGTTLTCSLTAPFGTLGGGSVRAVDAAGAELVLGDGEDAWTERVKSVQRVEPGSVIMITCENSFFLAADEPGCGICHHNVKPKVP